MATHDDHLTTAETAAVDLRVEALVGKACGSGTCPAVYRTNRTSLVVQGYAVDAATAGVELPAGENLVEIPRDVLLAAARELLDEH
ncbi:hypothetical protein [Actinoplanes sp. M2I2]|uniref:hypothetical protein n=1 Tax=Actinoplanes sp. M2I2 TaxID=1734444 RepID=UPI002020D4FD|nr:hypothetical protein [Actinoplanes sp. M2I2]